MIVTDLVCDAIRESLANHLPERGGALYGPRDRKAVTHFQYDAEGLTTSASYVPSYALIESVKRVEMDTGLQFKGIVHSHPHGLLEPSAGDEATVRAFFRLNPHISEMALPIVQQRRPDDEEPFLYWYRAERCGPPEAQQQPQHGGSSSRYGYAPDPCSASLQRNRPPTAEVSVIEEPLHILPLGAHTNELLSHLHAAGLQLNTNGRAQSLAIGHAKFLGLVASDDAGHELMYFVSVDYPVVPPLVLLQQRGQTRTLEVPWSSFNEGKPPPLDKIAHALCVQWKKGPMLKSKSALLISVSETSNDERSPA